MQSKPVRSSVKVAAVIVIACWVGLFVYYEVNGYLFQREREQGKAWVAEQVEILASDPEHLQVLVGVFDVPATEEWQRITARSIVCDHARLPDELVYVGECRTRWERLSAAIRSEGKTFARDEGSGSWIVTTGQESAEN